jgi:hypothetical protein
MQHVHILTLAENLVKYAHRLWYIDPQKIIDYESERADIIRVMKNDLAELRAAIHALEKGGDKND